MKNYEDYTYTRNNILVLMSANSLIIALSMIFFNYPIAYFYGVTLSFFITLRIILCIHRYFKRNSYYIEHINTKKETFLDTIIISNYLLQNIVSFLIGMPLYSVFMVVLSLYYYIISHNKFK